MPIHRRELLVQGAVTGAALVVAAAVADAAPTGQPPASPSGTRTPPGLGKHAPASLPFKSASLRGISERMITSHHGKNDTGAVKNLNKVEADLAALKPDAPGYLVAGLREKELTYFNSMVLHEHYFGNLGGSGKRTGALETRLGSEQSRYDAALKASAALG